MKKLIFVIVLLVAVSCTTDYQEIDPKKFKGVKIQVDSAQWSPALIRVDEAEVQVYHNNEIRELYLWNGVGCFFIGLVVGAVLSLILVITNQD